MDKSRSPWKRALKLETEEMDGQRHGLVLRLPKGERADI